MKFFESYSVYKEKLITEGGIYGNILHPYNDKSLSFSDLKDIIYKLFRGIFKSTVREKVDGLSLAVTYKNGKVLIIRNKKHVKNNSINALAPVEFKYLYDKEGYSGFLKGTNIIEKLFSKIDNNFLNYIFDNGKNVLTFEIICKDFVNVIRYDRNYLVLHEVLKFNLDGDIICRENSLFEEFISYIKENKLYSIDDFLIREPFLVDFVFKKEVADAYLTQIDNFLKINNIDSSYKIIDYKEDIKKIITSLGEYIINNMQYSLGKSQDNEIPSEGIVFSYNDTIYKLTGNFHKHMMKKLKK